jgi:hypothetical protein
MIDFEQKVTDLLVGQQCANFRLIEGGTLILFFEDPLGSNESPKIRFWIECAWRLRDTEQILIASLDSAEAVVDNLNKIRGCSIMHVEIDNVTKDLRVLLSSGFAIESFSYFLDDDVWEVRRTDGFRIGVGPSLRPFERFEAPD